MTGRVISSKRFPDLRLIVEKRRKRDHFIALPGRPTYEDPSGIQNASRYVSQKKRTFALIHQMRCLIVGHRSNDLHMP